MHSRFKTFFGFLSMAMIKLFNIPALDFEKLFKNMQNSFLAFYLFKSQKSAILHRMRSCQHEFWRWRRKVESTKLRPLKLLFSKQRHFRKSPTIQTFPEPVVC